MYLPPDAGHIEIITGCMFSGKTEELVRRLRRATFAKQKVVAFKPRIDTRYDAERLASHSGTTLDAIPVDNVADIWDLAVDARVVGIDEVQFFSEDIVEVVQRLADRGKRVIISGLDLDYRGVPFGPLPTLMAVAEYPTKLQAVCTICGYAASRSQRIADSNAQVLVGGATSYEARCRKHWSPQPAFSADKRMHEMED